MPWNGAELTGTTPATIVGRGHLYNLLKLPVLPSWHDEALRRGDLAIVMSGKSLPQSILIA
ncbi:MAG: hypothetical protein CMB61_02440 [Euryarchaeota archaeon]|nr:hypothetical protein [Euryarchaeota archaeon]